MYIQWKRHVLGTVDTWQEAVDLRRRWEGREIPYHPLAQAQAAAATWAAVVAERV